MKFNLFTTVNHLRDPVIHKLTMLAMLSVSGEALAAAPPNQPVIPVDPYYADQARRGHERYEDRQQELERIAPPSVEFSKSTSGDTGVRESNCFHISKILITGSSLINHSLVDEAVKKFENKCIYLHDIDEIIKLLNQIYIDKGFITTRAYLKEQRISDGQLLIDIIEGRIQGISINGENESSELEMAFPGLIGNTLNLRDIEQGLDQINRIPGSDAKVQIEPGDKPGLSELIITGNQSQSMHGKLSSDNLGSVTTGRNEANLGIDVNDQLGALETFSMIYGRNISKSDPGSFSNVASIDFSVPYGYWSVFGGFHYSNYRYRVSGLTQTFAISGGTSRYSINVNRIINRTQSSKTSIEIGYELKHESSYLQDTLIYTQSQDLASFIARVSYTQYAFGGAWYFTLGMKRGMNGIGSDVSGHGSMDPASPHAEYMKYSIDVNGYQPVDFLDGTIMWNPTIHAEYSDNVEYGSERFEVGGPYSVRGFRDQSIIGDRGFYIRNDIRISIPDKLSPVPIFSKNEFYTGIDAGWGQAAISSGSAAALDGGVAGGALGIRSIGEYIMGDVSFAHSFTNGPLRNEGWLISFQVSASF